MRVCFWIAGFIVVATFGGLDAVGAYAPEAGPHPAVHQSSSAEEALVWKSSTHCEHVVKDGGRMAVPDPDVLRVGTWNIRWFPHGSPPDRPDRSIPPTDLEWLTCTIVWMQTDILVVQESLTTTEARSAWDRTLRALDWRTGASWQWSVQQCGRPDGHHVGVVWNTNKVTLSAIQSLWHLNSKATSAQNPCEGGLRPGHYARVRSKRQPGADFHVIGLHLKSGPTVASVEARHAALNRIDTAVARFLEEDRDVVILGDFNTMGAGDRHSRRSELKYLRRMVAKESPGFYNLAPRAPVLALLSRTGRLVGSRAGRTRHDRNTHAVGARDRLLCRGRVQADQRGISPRLSAAVRPLSRNH